MLGKLERKVQSKTCFLRKEQLKKVQNNASDAHGIRKGVCSNFREMAGQIQQARQIPSFTERVHAVLCVRNLI